MGELFDLAREFHRRVDAIDVDAVIAMLTDDALGVDELSRRWIRGRADIEAHLRPRLATLSESRSDLRDPVETIQGDTGVVACWLEQDYVLGGERQHIAAPTTFVFRRENGAWRIALLHSIPVLQAATAIGDVLETMTRSSFDLSAVLHKVIGQAVSLSGATFGDIAQEVEPGRWAFVATAGEPLDRDAWAALDVTGVPDIPSPTSITAQVLESRKSTQRHMTDARFERAGARVVLGVPLVRDDKAIGVILLRRAEPVLFDRTAITLVETFAAQAVIAIENARLFNETKEALARQTAVAEILRLISASPSEVAPVLRAVAERAVELCDAINGSVYQVEGDNANLVADAGQLLNPDDTEGQARRWRPIDLKDPASKNPVAQTIRAGRSTEGISKQEQQRSRTPVDVYLLTVPIVRSGATLGAVIVRRWQRGFEPRHKALLETFAEQAAIAIENVRLFNETKEALERQTATAEVLEIISRSPSDVGPVFDAILERTVKLTRSDSGSLARRIGDSWRWVGHAGHFVDQLAYRDVLSNIILADRRTAGGRVLLEKRTVQIADQLADPEYDQAHVSPIEANRTILAVPLLLAGEPIGIMALRRRRVAPYSRTEIELAETYAAQAVIAIENLRLLTEIQDKSRQLEAASRHKSEFLANMSHELRTPLNAVIGFSDVLESGMTGELSEKQKEYVRDISASGKHLLDLVNEILDLSKVEAGRMELERSEFAVADTVLATFNFVRERAAKHAIELAADVPADLGTITADERKVRQVLLNLLSNAVKFTPDGGWIGVTARRQDGEITVSVKDTGIGIAPEDQARVFDEFQQVGKASDRSREGTGLGLTLAKRFIELHGGRIWLESEVGKGTTFTFALPVNMRSVAAAPAQA